MNKSRFKKYIIPAVCLIFLVILVIFAVKCVSCVSFEYSNQKYESELRLILVENRLNENELYLDAKDYDDTVFASYIEKDNINSSKIYVVDNRTIIQYYIDKETGGSIGVIFRRIDSETKPGNYTVIKMYHNGIKPYGLDASYPTNYFYVWVSLEHDCKPSKGLFHYANAENYNVFEINYGKEIINELHTIYVEYAEKVSEYASE